MEREPLSQRLGALLRAQTLGAFDDNLLKGALMVGLATGLGGARSEAEGAALGHLASLMLVVPFLLLSGFAGRLADRRDKATLARRFKALELCIMCVAAVAMVGAHVPILFACLFAMGAQSALFGPVKLGYLPARFTDDELVEANGRLEAQTFVAVLAGTAVGGFLIGQAEVGRILAAALMVTASALGYLASRRIPTTPPSPRAHDEPRHGLRFLLGRGSGLRAVALAGGVFWLAGAVLLGQLPAFAEARLGFGATGITALFALFTLAVGVGARLSHRVTGGRPDLGLTPIAALAIAAALLDLGLSANPSVTRVAVDLGVAGLAGGLFSVPLGARVQAIAPRAHASEVIGANNTLHAAFMVAGSGAAILSTQAGEGVSGAPIAALGVLVAFTAFGLALAHPLELMRALFRGVVHASHRVHHRGRTRLPSDGPALLVANHESFVDAFFVDALSPVPIRYVMDHRKAALPGLRTLARIGGAIPIAPAHEDPECLARAFDTIDEALASGEVVMIFPEGKVSRDGAMNPFRAGVAKILARRPVPVIPIGMRGLFGGMWSFAHGAPFSQLPRGFRPRVDVVVGEAVDAKHASVARLEAEVRALVAQANADASASTSNESTNPAGITGSPLGQIPSACATRPMTASAASPASRISEMPGAP